MFEDIKNLIKFLEKKIGEYYTGQIKISFEKGELIYINLTSKLADIPPYNNIIALKERIKKCAKDKFYGTIQFNLDGGIITGYVESQTFQGAAAVAAFIQRELRNADMSKM